MATMTFDLHRENIKTERVLSNHMDSKSAFTKVEYAVQLSCQSCKDAVSKVLVGIEGIKEFSIHLEEQQVMVETSLSPLKVQSLIESTGKKAVIQGIGSKPSSAAVAFLGYPVGFTTGALRGVVRFIEIDEKTCIVDGTIDGLSPGEHGIFIYSSGDLSRGCESIGEHYNPYNSPHGGPNDDIKNRHLGDLGNIEADSSGRAIFQLTDEYIRVRDIIGRSLGITSRRDDLGRGSTPNSKVDGDSGEKIGCGIIARAASVLQNPKKICLCSGETLWEEKATSSVPSNSTPLRN